MAEVEIIESYRDRAREDIQTAKLLLGSHLHLAAISRAYYGVFYAVTALLVGRGVVAHKHRQLGIEFRRHFVKTGTFSKKESGLLQELFRARLKADYDAIPDIKEERVAGLIKEAEEFVEALLALL